MLTGSVGIIREIKCHTSERMLCVLLATIEVSVICILPVAGCVMGRLACNAFSENENVPLVSVIFGHGKEKFTCLNQEVNFSFTYCTFR